MKVAVLSGICQGHVCHQGQEILLTSYLSSVKLMKVTSDFAVCWVTAAADTKFSVCGVGRLCLGVDIPIAA